MADAASHAPRNTSARRRLRIAALAGSALASLALAGAYTPVLVWNSSASSPRGLYAIASVRPRVGDFVIVWPPPGAARLAAARGYLPRGVPLVKTMVAGDGDTVCAKGARVAVNGRPAAVRRAGDGLGRNLPSWLGCRTLRRGEILVLGRGDRASFDGRYFGPSASHEVIGRARLLWRA